MATRNPIKPAPAPILRRGALAEGAGPQTKDDAPTTADGKLDASAAGDPRVGIDPRATEAKNDLDAAAGRVVAAAPTPTVESAATANEKPGEGGLATGQSLPYDQQDEQTQATLDRNAATDADKKAKDEGDKGVGEVKPRRRQVVEVEKVRVRVPHSFILTDDGGVQHNIGAGEQDLPVAHADHPYSVANGVRYADE